MGEENWSRRINAALVLSQIFAGSRNTGVHTIRWRHAVELKRWLVQHSPEDVTEVADLLVNMIDK